MSPTCVVCGQYVPGSHDVGHERVAVHERCHPGRATERRYGAVRGGDPR